MPLHRLPGRICFVGRKKCKVAKRRARLNGEHVDVCDKHFWRIWRHGSTEKRESGSPAADLLSRDSQLIARLREQGYGTAAIQHRTGLSRKTVRNRVKRLCAAR